MSKVIQNLQKLSLLEKVGVVFSLVGMFHLCNSKLFTQKNNTQNDGINKQTTLAKQRIICFRCNKDLTDSYLRINSNTQNANGEDIYYCTPCWKIVWKQATDDAKAEGY